MGIEAIGSAIGSAASAVGKGAAVFGAKLETPLGAMVKEGPARSLAGFKPMGAVDIKTPNVGGEFIPFSFGGIKPVGPRLNVTEVLAEANHWLGLDQSKVKVKPVANSVFTVIPRERSDRGNLPISRKIACPSSRGPVEDSLLAMTTAKFIPVIKRVVEPVAVPRSWVVIAPTSEPEEKTENKAGIQSAGRPETSAQAADKVAQVVSVKPVPKEQKQEEEVEEIVEERVQQERAEEGLDEEQITERRRYLTDEKALSQRKSEIRQAVIKAKTEADRLGLKKIAGWLVAKFLPAEHEGNRSEIVRKTGPDGSYQETVEAVVGAGEFASEERAMATFYQVAEERKPVRFGKEGKPVENQDVARVYKYRIVKPAQPFVEVITRVTKKRISKAGQSLIPVVELGTKQEISLKELDPALAEALKAA